MTEPLFVMLPTKTDKEFRETINKIKQKQGDRYRHGDRSKFTRQIIEEWVLKNQGV